jgi:hypothetical protein
MVQVHVTGMDTTDSNKVDEIINFAMGFYPTCEQFSFEIVDNTTLDIFITLAVSQ